MKQSKNKSCLKSFRILFSTHLLSIKSRETLLITIGGFLLILTSFYYLSYFLYTETYTWQISTLNNYFISSDNIRNECLVPLSFNNNKVNLMEFSSLISNEKQNDYQVKSNYNQLYNNNKKKNHYNKENQALSSSPSSPSTSYQYNLTDHKLINTKNHLYNKKHDYININPKIAMIMMYDNSHGGWNDDLMNKIIENKKKYSEQYGYDIIIGNDLIDPSRPSAWSKLKICKYYLNQYDYIFYIDMDAIIMNKNIPLETFITLAGYQYDFILTEDWNGINTGVFFVKNTKFSSWFLELAWNQTQLIKKKSNTGISYPFEYEQRSFHYLLNTKIWNDRKLPQYNHGNSTELLKHFYILPQCSMNSYVIHPLNMNKNINYKESSYVKNDFIVHMAGKKGRIKTNLLYYYLNLAENNFDN